MDKLSQVMFVLLCHVTCVAKQVAFHVDAGRIDQLIARLDGERKAEVGSAGDASTERARRVLQSRC